MSKLSRYLMGMSLLLAMACNRGKKAATTSTSGTIQISVDESFKPLLDTEIAVFEDLHPDAHIEVTYKSEQGCFRDFVNDSAVLIIATRPLNEEEENYFKDMQLTVKSNPLARDAVALIVNPSNTDTLMTMSEVRAMMKGEPDAPGYEVVFDQQNSSLVHYVIDSINGGDSLARNVKAAGGSREVVDYVASHKNALGVIGASWISNPYDSTGLSFLKKINVIGIMGDSTYNYLKKNPGFDPKSPEYSHYYYKPLQAYIALKSYPLTRTVYFLLREPYFGLGTGFANFLGGNKGQMIIGKERLFPLNLNIQLRKAEIH